MKSRRWKYNFLILFKLQFRLEVLIFFFFFWKNCFCGIFLAFRIKVFELVPGSPVLIARLVHLAAFVLQPLPCDSLMAFQSYIARYYQRSRRLRSRRWIVAEYKQIKLQWTRFSSSRNAFVCQDATLNSKLFIQKNHKIVWQIIFAIKIHRCFFFSKNVVFVSSIFKEFFTVFLIFLRIEKFWIKIAIVYYASCQEIISPTAFL